MTSNAQSQSASQQQQPLLLAVNGRNAKFLKFKGTPRFNESTDQARIETLFEPHHVVVVVGPNYARGDERLTRMSGTRGALERAFGAAAIKADAEAVSGFTMKADGSMSINSDERFAHVLGGYNAGLATSRYDVAQEPTHLQAEDEIAAANRAARDSLPQLPLPSHQVSLERTQDDAGADHYALFVTANDPAAARALRDSVRAAPPTLHDLAQSQQYKEMLAAAQCKRDAIAQQFARAHGVKLTSARPALTTPHYAIATENALAHGTHDSRAPQTGARTEDMYVVYNNTANTAHALKGTLVSHGVLGGHTLLESSSPKSDGLAPGAPPTVEWHQKELLSHAPIDSVAHHTVHSQVAARHRGASERDGEAFAKRVVWSSELGQQHQHPHANEAFNSLTDPYSAYWLDKLKAPGEPPLRQTHYKLVTAQLPDVTTQHLSVDELATLARHDATPLNVPVTIDSELVGRITSKWNEVRDQYDRVLQSDAKASGATSAAARRDNRAKLDGIFRNAYENDETSEMQMLASGATSLCADSTHQHANSTKLAPPSTVINLDKRLIRLLTAEPASSAE